MFFFGHRLKLFHQHIKDNYSNKILNNLILKHPFDLRPNKNNHRRTSTEFYKQHPAIKFAIQNELHNSITFLDLSVHPKETIF
jgi:hypothetical protein